MRLKSFLIEKKLSNPMIGLGINISDIKAISDYIESWLIRYNVPYDKVVDKHLTISQILGKHDKDELVRVMDKINHRLSLNPKGIVVLRGQRVPKDFIVIDYSPTNEFVKYVKDLSAQFDTFKFPKIVPHVSLFTVNQGSLSDDIIKDMIDGAPKLKKINATDVQLWNAKHEKEYIK